MIHTLKLQTAAACRAAPAVGLLFVAILSGCSLIEGKKDDYKRASRLPPLEIPPSMSVPTPDDRYAIPDPKDVAASATYSEYAKSRGLPTLAGGYVPGVGVDPLSAKAHLEVSGSERWLTVNGSPDQVYNTVKTFLTENGYEIGAENPQIGVIETQWIAGRPQVEDDGLIRNLINSLLTNNNANGVRDRYKFRIDRGRKEGTSEIFVYQKGLEEVQAGQDRTVWQARASEPDKEADMLKRLLLKFGVDAPTADQQLAGTQPGARPLSADAAEVAAGSTAAAVTAPGASPLSGTLSFDTGAAGEPRLAMGEGFDRAWRRLGLAIDRSGLALEDQDRDSGLYFVSYSADKVKDPVADPKAADGSGGGFFSRLGHAIWSKITAPAEGDSSKPVDLTPQRDLSTVRIPDGIYRLAVTQEDSNAHVMVLDKGGRSPAPDVARKLLNVLAAQLR